MCPGDRWLRLSGEPWASPSGLWLLVCVRLVSVRSAWGHPGRPGTRGAWPGRVGTSPDSGVGPLGTEKELGPGPRAGVEGEAAPPTRPALGAAASRGGADRGALGQLACGWHPPWL